MARIICVSNHKGGVGKTTAVANLSFALARRFKTLLIDLDPQANLSTGLGISDTEQTVESFIKDLIHLRSPVLQPIIITEYVHIIPCSFKLSEIENLLHEKSDGETVLKDILRMVKQDYDLIFIDCPPAMNLLTLNALNSSDLILVPAKPELFSVKGIDQIDTIIQGKDISVKVFFNQVNKRSLFHQKVMRETKAKYNGRTLNTYVRNTVSLAEAFGSALDIFHYKSESIGASDFIDLSYEVEHYI